MTSTTTASPFKVAASPVAKLVPPVSQWPLLRFKLKYRNTSRDAFLLAPFPDYAAKCTGAAGDEEVTPNFYDGWNERMSRSLQRKTPTAQELENFYAEMERCLRAGIADHQALRITSSACKTPFFRGVVSGLRYLMEQKGYKLGAAMTHFPNAFDDVAVAMVSAGELGGTQEKVFGRLAKRAATSNSLARKFYGAMVQPGITLTFLFGAILAMHFYILPQLEGNFKAIQVGDGKLPLPTAICVGVSQFIRFHPSVWVVPVVLLLLFLFNRREILRSKFVQDLFITMPVVGQAYRLLILARSLDALALLNDSGVTFDKCYHLAARVAGHYKYKDFFIAIYENHIKRGEKAAKGFLQERHRIGSEGIELAGRMEAAAYTGDDSETLLATATIMQDVADARMDALPKLLAPLVTVFTAVVIGNMAMAVLLPNFKLLIDALKSGAH